MESCKTCASQKHCRSNAARCSVKKRQGIDAAGKGTVVQSSFLLSTKNGSGARQESFAVRDAGETLGQDGSLSLALVYKWSAFRVGVDWG